MGPYGSIPGRGALAITGVSAAGLAQAGLIALAVGVILVVAAALAVRIGWRRKQAISVGLSGNELATTGARATPENRR